MREKTYIIPVLKFLDRKLAALESGLTFSEESGSN